MKRKEFIIALKNKLSKTNKLNREEVIFYYEELIQDAVDNGEDEKEFISRLGNVDEIIIKVSDDESFLVNIKEKNQNYLSSLLNSTVRLISLIIYYFLMVILGIVAISLLIGGGAFLVQTLLFWAKNAIESVDYLTLIGIILIGVGLIILGIEGIKSLLSFARNLKFIIIRQTKNIFSRERKKNE